MPLITLDEKTALIVVDLQKDIVNENFVHPIDEVIEHIRALLGVFRAYKLAVVLVNVAGRTPGRMEQGAGDNPSRSADWMKLVPEPGPQANDIAVTNNSTGAFATTNLERQLSIFHGSLPAAGIAHEGAGRACCLGILEGLGCARKRPGVRAILIMLFLIGTFGSLS